MSNRTGVVLSEKMDALKKLQQQESTKKVIDGVFLKFDLTEKKNSKKKKGLFNKIFS